MMRGGIGKAEAMIADLQAEREVLRGMVADLDQVLEDKRRLVRELDVALSGEDGAAEQASLCDLIGPAKKLRERVHELEAEINHPVSREQLTGLLDSAVLGRKEAERERDELRRVLALIPIESSEHRSESFELRMPGHVFANIFWINEVGRAKPD